MLVLRNDGQALLGPRDRDAQITSPTPLFEGDGSTLATVSQQGLGLAPGPVHFQVKGAKAIHKGAQNASNGLIHGSDALSHGENALIVDIRAIKNIFGTFGFGLGPKIRRGDPDTQVNSTFKQAFPEHGKPKAVNAVEDQGAGFATLTASPLALDNGVQIAISKPSTSMKVAEQSHYLRTHPPLMHERRVMVEIVGDPARSTPGHTNRSKIAYRVAVGGLRPPQKHLADDLVKRLHKVDEQGEKTETAGASNGFSRQQRVRGKIGATPADAPMLALRHVAGVERHDGLEDTGQNSFEHMIRE
jgi:hypothetical protein